ncbi:hypothetical protein CPB85DRAFT_1308858 [Mucidula mucida]|nr:hypothetical protein CPB85DRAFT_1308858 [Mucidula mucida]
MMTSTIEPAPAPLEPDVLDIRLTIKELNSRRLLASSSWLGEQLLSITPSKRKSNKKITLERDDEEDAILAARGSMDAHEYGRAAHFLRDAKSPRAWFLSIYSQFLASERAAIQEFHTMDSTRHQPPTPVNRAVADLYALVAGTADHWLMFLEGLFLFRLGRKSDAITVLLNSIHRLPWNWSAWCLLCDCIDSEADYTAVINRIPISKRHPAVHMFQIKTLNELFLPCHTLCDTMLIDFETSPWLLTEKAKNYYSIGAVPEAQAIFESIIAAHPLRLDAVDTFSSLLYVSFDLDKLAHYATRFKIFKDRPEACIFIGNTYALRGEHEKAIKYFIRATNLHPTYAPAYILLGHAYYDMTNHYAAIQAYRRALHITKKDFRIWFGLGQCYRALAMHSYALYYYQRGQTIRPHDIAIWEVLGSCYEDLNRPQDALHAYQRALDNSPQHSLPTVHHRMAKLLQSLAHFERVIEICSISEKDTTVWSDPHINSLLEAAELHMKGADGDLKRAREYLDKIATCTNVNTELGTRLNNAQTK